MSLDAALTIARSGLAAVQRGLAQTSQNVSNAETPGYTRKSVPQQAVVVGNQPAGLRTQEAARAVDTALLARLDASRAAAAGAGFREELLSGIEAAHGEAGAMLADRLAAMRTTFLALRAAPADAGKQQVAASAATDLADRLNGLSDAIGEARQQAQDQVVTDVATANAALREIASLTLKLKSAPDDGTAALEDRRDQAVARLAEVMDVQAVRQQGGDLLLVARGGLVLPLDPGRDVLATAEATLGPTSAFGAGGTVPGVTLNGLDATGQIRGGRLGEALTLRDRTLPRYQAEADLLAANLAARLDAQGLTLFTDSAGTGVPDTTLPYAGSAQVGFAGRIQVNPAVLANPALLRDGTHAVAGAAGGPTTFTPNPAGGPAGFTAMVDRVLDFALGAQASAGNPWPAIASTGLGPDGTLASPFSPPATLEDYASRLATAQLGDRAAATASKDQAATLQQALQQRFDKASGVDVDSEMAGMVSLQNAYAANARVMSTVQAMWDALLGAVR
ncbi:flagellar hook-associated protein FlgK [Paracraurococcus ruber]|uniref:Flagellar hook-associated protein 1 n=1 Tax=Paracraurococcus ruber TaxID=77675 RepID=A0ABS1D6A0_9PROT|nr:flagellar basal body rod C-terminal domain-containing protein [Paracraurococcus ruber]MBK1661792.1 hypothetical protein [Paracraurococcus ruber]TDG24301.1 hypothetical protein E2C05_26210 [Paracraurococcus ruber]